MKHVVFALARFAQRLNDENVFRKFYKFYLLFVLICAFFSVGWLQADEHARVIEPAHYLVRGFATLPWEFDAKQPIVSFLLAALHAPVLALVSYFKFAGTTEAFFLRAFSGFVCTTKLAAFYLLVPFFTKRLERRGMYTLLYAFGIFTPLLFVRTSQENWSSTALLWACYLFFVLGENAATSSESIKLKTLLGILIGLTFSFRFQNGFTAAALGFFCLATFGLRAAIQIGCGVLIGLLPMALVDWKMTGTPFLPAFNYLMYGADGNEQNIWGDSPPWWYFETFLTQFYPPISLALLPIFIYGVVQNRMLQVVVVPFFLIHQWIAHKEMRYYAPLLPFVYLSLFVGWEALEARSQRVRNIFSNARYQRLGLGLFAVTIVVSVAMGTNTLNSSVILVEHLRELHEKNLLEAPVWYAADSRSNVTLFYFKHPEALPNKIALVDFVRALDTRKLDKPAAYFALYRIVPSDLAKVEAHCRLEFLASSAFIKELYKFAERLPGKRRLDALVYCPASPHFTDDEITYAKPMSVGEKHD